MKKLVVLMLCLFTLSTVVMAGNDKPIRIDQLPQKAQQFLKTYFADKDVAFSKVESDWLEKSYDVMFTDGTKIEFNRKGEWSEVNCRTSEVPQGIVPSAIQNQVKKQYPDVRILSIERDSNDYELKLSNRWELKFDLQYNLIDMDN